MAIIDFFEKPGCQTNTRQKAVLREAGHTVVAHNLLTVCWDPASLRPYFGSEAVANWFNRSAPAIKQGTVVPERLSEEQALALMVDNPLLIKRPLLRVGERCCAGFEPSALTCLGLDITPDGRLNACAREGKTSGMNACHPPSACAPDALLQGGARVHDAP